MPKSPAVETQLSAAYQFLNSLDLSSAEETLHEALKDDFEDETLLFAMKCSAWWADAMAKSESLCCHFESGEYIISRWKVFRSSVQHFGVPDLRTLAAFKQFAFGSALSHYSSIASETEEPELAFRLGRASKGYGDYEKAVEWLEAATKAKRDDPALLAELADVYSLIDQARASKALFREAYFINPQQIDWELLESAIISALIEKARSLGKEGFELSEWIPVLAELSGVFSVKRELKPIEVGKLKQSIYEAETELATDGSRRCILVPRLINRYFWLIDHYLNKKEEKSKIDELLLKIKLLDPLVYKQYIS